MKIALFHNSYQTRGGEDTVFELEIEALRQYGHEVVPYHISNSKTLDQANLLKKFRTAISTPYSQSSYKKIRSFLAAEQPDIGHVHNWFPLISPSIYQAHIDHRIPVIQTLHNYRLGCASATYRREGKDCNLCRPGQSQPALKYKCYNKSLPATWMWKQTMDRNWSNHSFQNKVDRYICPSRIIYDKHLDLGLPKEKLVIIPNACRDHWSGNTPSNEGSPFQVCFAGRIVPEKGISLLLHVWSSLETEIKEVAHLTIIGEGPDLDKLQCTYGSDPTINFLGAKDHETTLDLIKKSSLLVCPSIWAEPFGLTVIEAMAASIPVLASNQGGPAELIDHGRNGLLVEPNSKSALSSAITKLIQNPNLTVSMGKTGRKIFDEKFTPDVHAKSLTECFEESIQTYTTYK